MNLMVTMNTGGEWTPDNVRRSHVHAAARWGFEYLELLSPTDDVFTAKHRALGSLSGFDRVLWVDGDVLIRSDAPVMGLTDMIEVVRGLQSLTGDERSVGRLALQVAERYWSEVGETIGVRHEFDPLAYFNGGIIGFSPAKHGPMFRWVADWCRAVTMDGTGGINPMVEQTILNLAPRVFGHEVQVWPEPMGRIGADAWDGDTMRTPVVHLATYEGVKRTDKRERLEAIEWEREPCLTPTP